MKDIRKIHEKREEGFREIFLKNFVKSLILHSAPAEIQEEFPYEEKIITTETPHIATKFKSKEMPQILQQIKPALQIRPLMRLQSQMPQIIKPKEQQIAILFAPFRKISPLLQDPGIISIECPGPEKNIVINKYGIIQTLPLTLTQEEINKIINDISERTRIPLIQGVFKAALESLIVTAVISEFVGTRFIIEKRRPTPQAPYPAPYRYRELR